jgi:hypothetical protein
LEQMRPDTYRDWKCRQCLKCPREQTEVDLEKLEFASEYFCGIHRFIFRKDYLRLWREQERLTQSRDVPFPCLEALICEADLHNQYLCSFPTIVIIKHFVA